MNITVEQPVSVFIRALENSMQAKTLRVLELLEEYGHQLGMPHSRALKGGLFELRIRGKQEVRLLYGYHSKKAIIVHAFIKKTQQTPAKELAYALKRLHSYYT